MIPKFNYIRPQTLQETVSHLQEGEAMIHAGGTDLLTCLRDQVFEAGKIVSLSGLKDMAGIKKRNGGGLRIGALATIAEIADHDLINRDYKVLAQAAAEVASPQIRNQGTIGGNLCQKPRCWYYRGEFHCRRKGGKICHAADGENQYHCIFGGQGCYIVHPSDTAPALAALGASLRIRGPAGERTVPVADFFMPPDQDVTRETVLERGEVVREVLLPPPPAGKVYSSYRKVRARQAWDFSLAGAALVFRFSGERVDRARVFLSGAAPVPWRSREVEEEIRGRTLDRETAARAAAAGVRKASPLAGNHYKVDLFEGMLEEELLKAGEQISA